MSPYFIGVCICECSGHKFRPNGKTYIFILNSSTIFCFKLWVFLAASPLASSGSATKTFFRARLQYRQLRRLTEHRQATNNPHHAPGGNPLYGKLLNAEVHTTQELNLLVILPDLSCERPRVRRHFNVKIQN